MPITVAHVKEEYQYIKSHPHRCGFFKRGRWKLLGRSLGLDLIEPAHQVHDPSGPVWTLWESSPEIS